MKRSAFTLVELLVVVAIIGILMGIAVAALTGCFSLETLNSYTMDKITGGLMLLGWAFCFVAYKRAKK